MEQTTAQPRHAIAWFEIPVRDLDRATAFYEALLATSLKRQTMGGSRLAVFPYGEGSVGGALIAGDTAPAPSSSGTLVYLPVLPSVDAALARAEAAGGRLDTPKVQLPGDIGCIAMVIDTEGNRVGLHAAR